MRRWNEWRFLTIINQTVHEESSQETKFGTLEWFGKYVGPHEFRLAVLKVELPVMIVANEEIFRLDVLSPFEARNVAILSQGKCAHVVLKNNVIGDSVTLCFKKIPSPEDITRLIIKTDDFTLGGTLGRYFVLGRQACCCTLAKCENGARMSFAIIMCLMGCIKIPVEIGERVGEKCEEQFASGIKNFEKFLQFAPIVFVRLFDTCGEKSDRWLNVMSNTQEKHQLSSCVMEGTGLLLRKERRLVWGADIKQVISSRRGRHPCNFLREAR